MKVSKKRWVSLAVAAVMAVTVFVPASASAATWKYPTQPKTIDKDIARVAAHNAAASAPEFLGANLVTVGNPVAGATEPGAVFEKAQENAFLAIFGTSMNANADPYMWNYYYNTYARANGKSPTNSEDAVYPLPSLAPMMADTTPVTEFNGAPASVYLKPDILLGIGTNSTTKTGYTEVLESLKKSEPGRYGSYNPILVDYKPSTMTDQMDTMYRLAKAINDSGKTGRYGDPVAIAKNYEKYIKGIQYYIWSQIKQGKTEKKTIAIIDATSASEGGKFTAYTSNVVSGTAKSTRAAEYLENTTDNLIDTLKVPNVGTASEPAYKLTPKQVAKADAIYITGHQGGSMSEDEFLNLMNKYGIKSKDVPPVYAALPKTTYGIVMNSVENGVGFGLFQGFVYSDIINPVYAAAYFQEKFYHVTDNTALKDAITNTFEGSTFPEGVSADISNYTAADFESKLNTGWAYYAANKASIDSAYPKLKATENMTLPDVVEATGVKLNKATAKVEGGKTVTLKATVTPANASDKGVTWKSSNSKVAAVSTKGQVKGVAAGTATITATTHNGKTASCKVTVTNTKQTISGASAFTKAYGAKAFSLGAKAKGKLTYKTSDKNVAAVSAAGKVTIKNTGRAVITIKAAAASGYKAATKKVTVTVTPKKAAISKLRSAKKGSLQVSWKKDTRATGYQVMIAKNKAFTSGKKTAAVTKAKTTSKTFTKLSAKKTYYAKVRAYKTISGKKVYGAYSSVKSKRVK